jgi:hypothetical protein
MAEIAAIRRHQRLMRVKGRVQVRKIGAEPVWIKPGWRNAGGEGAVRHQRISLRATGWLVSQRWHGSKILSNGKFRAVDICPKNFQPHPGLPKFRADQAKPNAKCGRSGQRTGFSPDKPCAIGVHQRAF